MKSKKPYLHILSSLCLMVLGACTTLDTPFSSNFGKAVPVIMYHRIVPDELKVAGISEQTDVSLYTRTASEFRVEMTYLAEHGFTPITFDQLADYLASKDASLLPVRPVIITFDDGSTDWFDIVLPILVSHKIKATFFLITDDEARRKYLDDFAPITWPQIEQMAAYKTNTGEPLLAFESHTHTHMDLSAALMRGGESSLPTGEELRARIAIVKQELDNPMRIIQEKTGRRPAFLALPYGAGAWDSAPDNLTFPVIKALAREAGYRGMRSSRNDIPNNLTTDPYLLGARLTMLSITTYEQFVERLKLFETD